MLYKVKSNIGRDGKSYVPGDSIDLTPEEAAAMPWAVEAPPAPVIDLPKTQVAIDGEEIPGTIEAIDIVSEVLPDAIRVVDLFDDPDSQADKSEADPEPKKRGKKK